MVNAPQISLKVIVSVHFALTVWASMAGFPFLPPAYIYMNAFILAFGVWAIVSPESTDAVLMFLGMNLGSIVMDIIFLGIYTPQGQAGFVGKLAPLSSRVSEYRFCLGMSIVNLIIKPFTSFVLYRLYQERGGHYGDLGIPGLPSFGVGAGQDRSSSYDNIDHGVETAQPHDLNGQTPPPRDF